MNYKYTTFLFLSVVSLSCFAQNNAPSGLLCDLLPHPELATITNSKPDFGWIVNASVKDDYQTAYQIQVATSATHLQTGDPDLWDSGKIKSNQSINVRYNGKALQAHQKYYWRVCTWGEQANNPDGAVFSDLILLILICLENGQEKAGG